MRFFNPLSVWTLTPVASRTVEVNTKTGFSLTAGSYAVRASSTQIAELTILNATSSNTATVSSVTTTRASLRHAGAAAPNQTIDNCITAVLLTNATTVTARRIGSTGAPEVRFELNEFF